MTDTNINPEPVSNPEPASQSDRLSALESRIDSLIAATDKHKSKSFIHDPTQLIAVAAFIISLGTTVISGYRTYQQDKSQVKSDLRTAIMQLNANYVTGAEMGIKYKDNGQLASLASYINSYNTLNARQAYSILQELGSSASAFDHMYVAFALKNASNFATAEQLGKKALDLATNTYDYVAASELLGGLSLANANLNEADVYLQQALNVFNKFDNEKFSDSYIKRERVRIYLYFISNANDCAFAKNKMAEVDTYFGAGQSITLADLAPQRQFLKQNVQKYCDQADLKSLMIAPTPPVAHR